VERHRHRRRRHRTPLQVREEQDLAGARISGQHLLRQPERRAEVHPGGRRAEGIEHGAERPGLAPARDPVGGDEPEAVRGGGPVQGRARRLAERLDHLAPVRHDAGGERVVEHQRERGGRVGAGRARRQRRAGRGEDEGEGEQRAHREQQPVPQAQAPLVLAGGVEQVAHRGERHGGRLPPGQEMEQERQGREGECGEHPRLEKADHARLGRTSAARSASPKGVSVVIRW
jgi:hypothetical protein